MKIKNKKTGIIKEPRTQVEVSMYLATNEWEIVSDKNSSKSAVLSTPSSLKSENKD